MFRVLRFFLLLVPTTIYYSIRQLLLDQEKGTADERDWPGKTYGSFMLRMAGIKVEADLSALDPKANYVFMCNHQSLFDIPILFNVLKGYHMRFVAKESLFKIPIYGKALGNAGHISINRGNRRAAMKSLDEAVAAAKAGIAPLIFPEGTRNPDLAKLMDFKVGGMVLALKCGLPVAPLVMEGTGRLLPKGALFFNPDQLVRLRALPPVDPSAYTMKDRDRFRDDMYALMNDAYQKLARS
ncbi:MAG: 1-acyl-sn-glycerol-3-phosphate acyltransferase [Proteobacteria bacterium]|nr:1-acyl-sn-glycerol-3-phosphate acyltransferase [Pseudomonadota bacterium]MBU1595860.1 1-acyl-sn-glycerol-3-phosphate acyltransferase [Pseudomonadota bacterium]